MSLKNYDDFLFKKLQDRELAAAYLNEALKNGSLEEFLIALRNVARAYGGIQEISQITKLNRQSLYKMLSENGNPTLANLFALLKVMGIRMTFSPSGKKRAA